jgi:hypothetical protein
VGQRLSLLCRFLLSRSTKLIAASPDPQKEIIGTYFMDQSDQEELTRLTIQDRVQQRFKVGYEDGADYSASGVAVGEKWTTLEYDGIRKLDRSRRENTCIEKPARRRKTMSVQRKRDSAELKPTFRSLEKDFSE